MKCYIQTIFEMKIVLMFVYQPTFNMLELKKDKSIAYVIGWKSKGLF